jgi:hypothetical protein
MLLIAIKIHIPGFWYCAKCLSVISFNINEEAKKQRLSELWVITRLQVGETRKGLAGHNIGKMSF